jgi:hypothetical protein
VIKFVNDLGQVIGFLRFMKRNLNCDDKLIHQYQQNDQSPQIIEDKKEHDII